MTLQKVSLWNDILATTYFEGESFLLSYIGFLKAFCVHIKWWVVTHFLPCFDSTKKYRKNTQNLLNFAHLLGSGECFSCKSWLPNKSWETKLLQWLSDFSLLPIKWRDMGGPERVVVQFSENFWHRNICLSGCGISDNLFHLASWTLHQVTALDVLVTWKAEYATFSDRCDTMFTFYVKCTIWPPIMWS